MDFDKRKAATLASLGSSDTDKSPKGSLDAPIIPLLDSINAHHSYFTTSSCSGRISILSQPSASTTTKKKKARGGSWIFISHHLADPNSVLSVLFPGSSHSEEEANQPGELVFRFEPLIVAVECRNLSSAQDLVALAIASGFRESGITSAGKRVIVGIRCSIRMEVPLGDTDRVMVSEDYVRFLVEVSNEKMEANWKRTNGFLQAFRAHCGSAVNGAPDAEVDSSRCNGRSCDDNGIREDDLSATYGNSDNGSSV